MMEAETGSETLENDSILTRLIKISLQSLTPI